MRFLPHKIRWFFSVILLAGLCSISTAKTIYVDGDATGANNGSSWENAYIYLTDALDEAEHSYEKPIEIHVAQGIYTPDMGANAIRYDRLSIFWLINGVTISGGYAGNGEPDPNTRDIELYETILSGDLYSDDVEAVLLNSFFYEPSRYENCFNVITGSFTDSNAVLDGFTIRSGAANGNQEWYRQGGGMYNYNGKPTIIDCKFTLNAAYNGAAMYNENSNPTITNCLFYYNDSNNLISLSNTAGIFDTNSSPVLTGCTFIENRGNGTGGMANQNNSNPVLTDCVFISNYAFNGEGGGLYNDNSNPVLINCTFTDNNSVSGGGIANYQCNPTIIGCNFTGNLATDGAGIFNNQSEPNIIDCLFNANWAQSLGGGIKNTDSKVNIINCKFIGNRSYQAAGIYNEYSDVTLKNCIITGNRVTLDGSSILNEAGKLKLTNCTVTNNVCIQPFYEFSISFEPQIQNSAEFTNCILWNGQNTIQQDTNSIITVNYSDIQGEFDGVNNINQDPCFTKQGYWVDIFDPNIVIATPVNYNVLWIDGDYHLKSEAGRFDPNSEMWIMDTVTSPCIDSGDSNSPVAFEPNPNGTIINMGAYGGTTEASKSPSGLHAKYGGGTGEPNNPYQIYTAEHLNTLSSNTSDYNKHFKLMTDVNMAEYLYDRAVIAPSGIHSSGNFTGFPFNGSFDGNGYVISNLTIDGHYYLGLFGYLDGHAIVSNLGIEAVDINGVADYIASLAGYNYGSIIGCYCTGIVDGNEYVGGLVGDNTIGSNIINCYSMTTVNGNEHIGGIAGYTKGNITTCYSTGAITGTGMNVGGLAGERHNSYGIVTDCFWDIETSGQTTSAGGVGLTTIQMQSQNTFTDAGWDFVGESVNGNEDIWRIDKGDYPHLWWEMMNEY